MNFYVRKRRGAPTIIIVALIDVLIVLLIFLMVTTTFKQQQFAMKLALPESKQSEKSGASDTQMIEIAIDAKGDLRLITGPDALPVTMERFKEELMSRAAKNPDLRLAISADKAAPWGQVVKIWDAAKDAKVKTVNAATKEVKQ